MGKRLFNRLQGLQKNSLKNRKIRIHPQPFEDESLSSWFCRMAVKNLCTPIAFLNLYLGDYKPVFQGDLDWGREDFIRALSEKTGIEEEKVYSLSLRSYEGFLFEKQKKYNSYKPFINQTNFRGGRNRGFAVRFCPYCLREQEYFRKKWRLTFSTACTKHGVFLLDRCPECGEPLTIQKWRNDKESFHCWRCGFEFKKAEAEKVPEESKGIDAIEKLYEILEKGYFEFEGRVYYSIAFFQVMEHFAKIVYTWKKRKWKLLEMESEILNVRLSDNTRGKTYLKASIKEQYLLFTTLSNILSSKENIRSFIKRNNLKSSKLTQDFGSYPFWYKEFVDEFNDSYYSPTLEEVKSAVAVLEKTGRVVNWKNLQKIMGRCLEARKRADIKELLFPSL